MIKFEDLAEFDMEDFVGLDLGDFVIDNDDGNSSLAFKPSSPPIFGLNTV